MQGAGNDFVLFDCRNNNSLRLSKSQVIKLSDRKRGVGGDGVMVVSDSSVSGAAFGVDYYNPDGTSGMLCGNGARCAVKYALSAGYFKGNNVCFSFNGRLYHAEVLEGGLIKFFILEEFDPGSIWNEVHIEALDKNFVCSFLDTGALHVVVEISEIKDLQELDVNKYGQSIRNNDAFSPKGANVNFFTVQNDSVYIRTFERGVESETLSCGTGATAVAINLIAKKKFHMPVTIYTRGGDVLSVDAESVSNNKLLNISLSGPAVFVFSGDIVLL